ncbi:hypothetical protein M8997_021975 [Phyllobacterium sp. 21LDTY02-6]|jgi:hypothetical protein|uniref:hypothetical protein n=1 Tax=unclassified Phyllobacterium TaxID=2638441 RepID=UPI002021C48F|nr:MULTISPECIES: hypothetical protein [unclassified Phyllobacterium]MCO4319862.1 hypothetical protein [Phyllobacterium sp. 21LDTY02-6]MCX8280605.1 hypothetical protein [Phyllobacterium sp. 0TCS1.6C]MCX8296450.1 hypothetical protein [Phyllobacterium sp. 0TCS1.6A]
MKPSLPIGAGLLLFCLCLLYGPRSLAQEEKLWTAGRYSFSDEMGGFTIRGISGRGTEDDPIVLVQEFNAASPVLLVIRTESTALRDPADDIGILFYLRVEAINGGGHPWVEFAFELQEQLNLPSDYGDGLSFYQPGHKVDSIKSDGFRTFKDDFEPYDRMIFTDGVTNPAQSTSFVFPIADFTPKRMFYLVQDPRIPSS